MGERNYGKYVFPFPHFHKLHLLVVIIFAASFCLSFSCKESPTSAEKRIKHPREMTWAADTLPVPESAIQILPEDMLVFSPTDIWLAVWIGHGQLMHYDGRAWRKSEEAGGINCLNGTQSNDIWAGGYFNNIYLAHYNGEYWQRENEIGIKGEILDLTSNAGGNLWACGRNGLILKYDKTKWIADTIKINHPSDAEYFLNSIEYYKNKVHIISRISDSKKGRDVYHYITGDLDNWSILDSMVIDQPNSIFKWGQWKLFASSFGKFYSIGQQGVWVYDSTNWIHLFQYSGAIYSISGPNEDYLLAVGDFKKALFYNGDNWENVSDIFYLANPSFMFTDVWSNGNETIIVGYGVVNGIQKTIVWHGK